MFGPKGPFCQSCGMPLSKDKGGGGTEADGRKTGEYCSNCYRDGAFTEPDITLEQMQDKVTKMMKEAMHLPGFMAKHFIKTMPKLRRWSANS
jgi:hypothetical protein